MSSPPRPNGVPSGTPPSADQRPWSAPSPQSPPGAASAEAVRGATASGPVPPPQQAWPPVAPPAQQGGWAPPPASYPAPPPTQQWNTNPYAAQPFVPAAGSVPGGHGYYAPYVAQSAGQYASAGSRIIAYIVDSIIATVVAVIPAIIVAAIVGGSNGGNALAILVYLIIVIGYFVVLEARSGQTFGKKMLGIRVVKLDGTPVDGSAALVRGLLKLVDSISVILPIGLWLIIFQSRKQRIGDMAANTLVVKDAWQPPGDRLRTPG